MYELTPHFVWLRVENGSRSRSRSIYPDSISADEPKVVDGSTPFDVGRLYRLVKPSGTEPQVPESSGLTGEMGDIPGAGARGEGACR